MLSRSIQHALVVLVAASALAASPAFSEPAAHTSRQDVRGERARDAARHAPFGHPTWRLGLR
jgi:hypothetical protein